MDFTHPAVEHERFSAAKEGKPRFNGAVRFLPAFSGFMIVVWAFSRIYFRNAEGAVTADFCLPLAAGAALILGGVAANTGWKTFARWAGLAIVGQADSLQMINAGRLIHFQHYRPPRELLNEELLAVCLLAVQIIFVAWGVGKRLPQIKRWLSGNFDRWRLIAIAVFMIFAGAAVTPILSIYATSLFLAATVQLVNLANIALAVCSLPEGAIRSLQGKFQNFFSDSEAVGLDRFAAAAAVWVFLLSAALSYFVYENHPHVPDETQYIFQARLMAAGQVASKPPLVPEAFAMYMTPHLDERWYGIFPPAFPAALAVGILFGAKWLVNPLFAGLCVLLAYIFFQQFYARRFARVAVTLLCCSPWFVFMAMSLMSHVFTLFCALAATVLLNKSIAGKKLFYAFFAGLFVGVVSLIRPLDGLIVAALLGFWALLESDFWPGKIKTSAALVCGTVTTASIVFPYNKAVTGAATLLPMDAYYTKYYWPDVMALGFGANRGIAWGIDAFPGHSPLESLVNAALNIFSLNIELFGWATGSLFLSAFVILTGGARKKDFWAIGVIAVITGCYSLYWYSGGPDFGARYWFLCIVPLIALTVSGLEQLGRRADSGKYETNPRVLLAVLTLCAISLTVYFPWRAADKYYRYLGMQPGVRELADEYDFGRSLVLIRGAEHPDYQSAWTYNPLNFEGDAPIFAHDKNAEISRKLLNAYADRKVWIIEGPTLAGGRYRILRGPVEARELLSESSR